MKILSVCIMSLLIFSQSFGQTFPANFSRVKITGGLASPSSMTFTPDGRILVCELAGKLRVVKNSALLAAEAINVNADIAPSGERGLLGVAVDPDFDNNKYVYLHYTVPAGKERTAPFNKVMRYVMNGDILDPASKKTVIEFNDLSSATNHNGGALSFGPDGKLYIGVGDNANGANSQNLDTYLGKVLRINADGTVPAGNPFTGSAAKARVWAYGLRNPFALAFDPASTKMFISEVGQVTWEEINDATAGGKNFGWPSKEGFCTSACTGFTDPVYTYPHPANWANIDGQGCAIVGGTFLNALTTNYPAQYRGKYFFMDYCNSWINFIDPANPSQRSSFGTNTVEGTFSSFILSGPDGNIYYFGHGSGSLYKVVYNSGGTAPTITNQPASTSAHVNTAVTLSVQVSGTGPCTYVWTKNGMAIPNATAASLAFSNVQFSDSGKYQVVVRNAFGPTSSQVAILKVLAANQKPVAVITAPLNNAFFRYSDVINFTGTGSDAEDGTLPASAFDWTVIFHHDQHVHPGPAVTDGVKTGSFKAEVAEVSANIYYELRLIVSDSKGLKDTATVRVNPVTANQTIATNPAGLEIKLDVIPFTAPYKLLAVSGMPRPLEVTSPQTLNGIAYEFVSWSQGGTAKQTVVFGDSPVAYTAMFKKVVTTDVIDFTANEAFVVFPNPVTDKVKIISSVAASVLTLADTYGNRVLEIPVYHSGTEIDLSFLQAGIYILQFDHHFMKIVKQK